MIEYKTENFVATAYLYVQLDRLWSEHTGLLRSIPLVEILLTLRFCILRFLVSYDDTLGSPYPGNVLPDGEELPTKLR